MVCSSMYLLFSAWLCGFVESSISFVLCPRDNNWGKVTLVKTWECNDDGIRCSGVKTDCAECCCGETYGEEIARTTGYNTNGEEGMSVGEGGGTVSATASGLLGNIEVALLEAVLPLLGVRPLHVLIPGIDLFIVLLSKLPSN